MKTRMATISDLPQLATLFDAYRGFYQQQSDLPAAERFLRERMAHQESVIFVVEQDQQLLGFTQLYPIFSSVSIQRLWLLNDLYVSAAHRRQGVARMLMNAARVHAEQTGAKGLTLETGISNHSAQKLYEVLGYEQQDEVFHYFLSTPIRSLS